MQLSRCAKRTATTSEQSRSHPSPRRSTRFDSVVIGGRSRRPCAPTSFAPSMSRLPRSAVSSPSRSPTRPCSPVRNSHAGSPSADRRDPSHIPDPVQAERVDNTLYVRFNRPQRHNAFSTDARAALLEALEVARLDPSVTDVVLVGQWPLVLQRWRPGRVRHVRRSGHRPSGAHPAQPRIGARRTERAIGPALPRGGARSGTGQRTGDGRLLRVGAVAAGRRVRPAGVGPRPDPRRRRHREHHPADRALAHSVSGVERARPIGPETALRWGLIDEIV